jgi:hypothetical protein
MIAAGRFLAALRDGGERIPGAGAPARGGGGGGGPPRVRLADARGEDGTLGEGGYGRRSF